MSPFWDKYKVFQKRMEVPPKTMLLNEGETSKNYIFIESGCIRTFFNNNGSDKTVQFFFENEGLTSFDSFVNSLPSQFAVETIEHAVLYVLPKNYVLQLIDELSNEPYFVNMMLKISAQRHTHYVNEFVSFIRDTAEERYARLLLERPYIIKRVPQHYIASYLGITTVHLSRIKNKLVKGKAHF